MSTNWQALEKTARDWTYEAAELIKDSFSSSIRIETKSNPDDLVTEVDREIENFFYDKIARSFPHHDFIGEEGAAQTPESLEGTVWIIDPIDGTMNFVHQQENFAISVAVYHHGIGKIGIVYDVMNDALFHAVKGGGAFLNESELVPVKDRPLQEAVIGIN